MILDWNNEYCENDYAIQCNLQIQYNPYQIINGILDRIKTKKKKFTICMETQNTQIPKAILRKKNGAGRSKLTAYYTSKLQ